MIEFQTPMIPWTPCREPLHLSWTQATHKESLQIPITPQIPGNLVVARTLTPTNLYASLGHRLHIWNLQTMALRTSQIPGNLYTSLGHRLDIGNIDTQDTLDTKGTLLQLENWDIMEPIDTQDTLDTKEPVRLLLFLQLYIVGRAVNRVSYPLSTDSYSRTP